MKEYRQKNKEKISEQIRISGKKWYQANKERKLKKGREWCRKNRKRVVEIVQKYVRNNKEKVKKYLRNYEQSEIGLYRTTKYSAKKRNYEFNLSLNEFKDIVSKSCIYCNENKKRIGIDRIDNFIGYTKENSVSCCKNCNMMKKDLSKKEFLSHIEKIYKWNNEPK